MYHAKKTIKIIHYKVSMCCELMCQPFVDVILNTYVSTYRPASNMLA